MRRRRWEGVDWALLVSTGLLIGVGLVILYSASFQRAQETGTPYVQKQLAWIGIGCVLAASLLWMDYHRWLGWAYVLYAVTVALLLLVLLAGTVRGGAQRWITLGGWTIQPSEFAKIAMILALARLLGSAQASAGSWTILAALILAGVPMGLVLLEPNLGTAAVFGIVGLAMLFAWGIRLKYLLGLGAALALAAPLGWFLLEDYQRARLLVFLNPGLDPLGAGYTVIQSKIAAGSGMIWGKGWLAGTQNQLNFLPERHTDFIFSVLAEEWGFLGTSLCLGLFALFFYRALRIAACARDPSGRLLVVGLATLLAIHAMVNTGMVVGLAPVVGLPLPFMSYGGSWAITCLVAVGMILSVGIRRPV